MKTMCPPGYRNSGFVHLRFMFPSTSVATKPL